MIRCFDLLCFILNFPIGDVNLEIELKGNFKNINLFIVHPSGGGIYSLAKVNVVYIEFFVDLLSFGFKLWLYINRDNDLCLFL